MKYVFWLLLATTLVACGHHHKDQTIIREIPGPTVVVPEPDVPLTDVEQLIADENDYRLGLGQTMLSSGLSCTVRQVTGGQNITGSVTPITFTGATLPTLSFLSPGVFDQPSSNSPAGNNVLPPAIRAMYGNTNLYLSCTGQIVVTDTDFYQFTLSSDDGALLYLDGSVLINNDGNHAVTTKSGTKYLRRGIHTFRLDYAQTGSGNYALILTANGAAIDTSRFYH